EGRLRGLVATAIETDDEAIADELVLAHAGDRGKVLDALGCSLGCGAEENAGGHGGNRSAQQEGLDPEHGEPRSEWQDGKEEALQPAHRVGLVDEAAAAVLDARVGHLG